MLKYKRPAGPPAQHSEGNFVPATVKTGKFSDMIKLYCRGVPVVLIWLLAGALVSAQITFSRDWSGGKRSAPQLALDCAQFPRLCRHFVHDLKQAMSSDMTSKRRRDDDKVPPIYDDEK